MYVRRKHIDNVFSLWQNTEKPVFLVPRSIAHYPLSNDSLSHVGKGLFVFGVWTLKKAIDSEFTFFPNTINIYYV